MARREAFDDGASTGQYHLPRLKPEDVGLPHDAPEEPEEEPFGDPVTNAKWEGIAEGKRRQQSYIEEEQSRKDQTPGRQKQLRGQIERADDYEDQQKKRQASQQAVAKMRQMQRQAKQLQSLAKMARGSGRGRKRGLF